MKQCPLAQRGKRLETLLEDCLANAIVTYVAGA